MSKTQLKGKNEEVDLKNKSGGIWIPKPCFVYLQYKEIKVMALFVFTNLNKHGNLRKRIMYRPTSQFSHSTRGLGPFTATRRFKYIYEHDYLPPTLYTNSKGEKYIIPTWQKVHPETTLNDIEWHKPKPKKIKVEKQEFKFESKSDPGHFYNVTVKGDIVDCTCAGKWRAKDRQCRHIKDIKKQLGI